MHKIVKDLEEIEYEITEENIEHDSKDNKKSLKADKLKHPSSPKALQKSTNVVNQDKSPKCDKIPKQE